jgi:sugar phosphate isomerase/epimerase
MIKSCVTIALVPTINSGPWVYWDDLELSIQKAAALGFDAVELFTASGSSVDANLLRQLLNAHKLKLAAIGTGAGKVLHGLSLTDPDKNKRAEAIDFIKSMIDFGSAFGAPAIIGSMQGNIQINNRTQVIEWFEMGMHELDLYSSAKNNVLLYEPLNRYETNLFNTLGAAADFTDASGFRNVMLLADLFHMNIEEDDIPETIRTFHHRIGHIHFADSNRKAIGFGHSDMSAIAAAIKSVNYQGYLSAEIFPLPDSDAAAKQTIQSFIKYFRE